jgi:hypothetical protein
LGIGHLKQRGGMFHLIVSVCVLQWRVFLPQTVTKA